MPPVLDAKKEVRNLPWLLDYVAFKKILSSTHEESAIALVTFESELVEGYSLSKKVRTFVPLTSVMIDSGKGQQLRVKGTLSSVAILYGDPPKLGSVDKRVPVAARSLWTRYRPFMTIIIKEMKEPVSMLVFWKDARGDVLDGEFIGPLTAEDVQMVNDFKKVIEKLSLPKLSTEEARALLMSTNPLAIFLGVYKLEERDAVTDKDFFQAIKSMPAGYSESTMIYLLRQHLRGATSAEKRDALTSAIIKAFEKSPPEKKKEILRAVNTFATELPGSAAEVIDVPELRRRLESGSDEVSK